MVRGCARRAAQPRLGGRRGDQLVGLALAGPGACGRVETSRDLLRVGGVGHGGARHGAGEPAGGGDAGRGPRPRGRVPGRDPARRGARALVRSPRECALVSCLCDRIVTSAAGRGRGPVRHGALPGPRPRLQGGFPRAPRPGRGHRQDRGPWRAAAPRDERAPQLVEIPQASGGHRSQRCPRASRCRVDASARARPRLRRGRGGGRLARGIQRGRGRGALPGHPRAPPPPPAHTQHLRPHARRGGGRRGLPGRRGVGDHRPARADVVIRRRGQDAQVLGGHAGPHHRARARGWHALPPPAPPSRRGD
mmetsp:Transcript_7406/g.20166  ORF Transcript_7406/g.20166 Transcript_7406/m.20166 type:complete len:307 (+) Transcript_7406:712-1632(+)